MKVTILYKAKDPLWRIALPSQRLSKDANAWKPTARKETTVYPRVERRAGMLPVIRWSVVLCLDPLRLRLIEERFGRNRPVTTCMRRKEMWTAMMLCSRLTTLNSSIHFGKPDHALSKVECTQVYRMSRSAKMLTHVPTTMAFCATEISGLLRRSFDAVAAVSDAASARRRLVSSRMQATRLSMQMSALMAGAKTRRPVMRESRYAADGCSMLVEILQRNRAGALSQSSRCGSRQKRSRLVLACPSVLRQRGCAGSTGRGDGVWWLKNYVWA
ncbi:hypothetical protein DFJ73DRAFT_874875 [Zopfochytrium polystomum]|nr:hypothetical protein DFJ73DRAFT_874875 [Zopfochytrium polystomum]